MCMSAQIQDPEDSMNHHHCTYIIITFCTENQRSVYIYIKLSGKDGDRVGESLKSYYCVKYTY